ncbi:MAG: signal peptidase I [Chloroflexota bacterium]|nr:signal peptidase I [Chloroflexota bacterium]
MVQEEQRPSPPAGSVPVTGAASQWGTTVPEAATPGDIAPVPSTTTNSGGRAIREIVETLLLAALIFFVVRLVVLNFRVDGNSMVPNLQDEQMLLVNVNAYRHFDLNNVLNLLPGDDQPEERMVWPFGEPQRGDIIVFNPDADAEQPYIKRIIGLPGETITFQDGYVHVNGQQLDESYIDGAVTECRRECDMVVNEDHVYVLGDNRNNSTDSRSPSVGQVPLSNVIGKAWLSYWPMDLFGFVPHYDYPNDVDANAGVGTAPNAAAPAASPETREERRERRQRERAADEVPTLVPQN